MFKVTNSVIFCIGFNKTGTVSLHEAFVQCGLRSFHDKRWIEMVNSGKLPNYDVFSDGDVSQLDLNNLKRMSNNCKFILNTRSLKNWLVSRCKHAFVGYCMGRRSMYQLSDIVYSIHLRKNWHKKALSLSPLVFDIEDKEDHKKLSQFLNLNMNIPHLNRRENLDKETLSLIERDVEEALQIANIPQSSWLDVI